MKKKWIFLALTAIALTSCHDDNSGGKEVTPELPDYYYTGGKLGTTSNVTASAYEQETEAINKQGLLASFKRGERIFESPFDIDDDESTPMRGLGPLWVRDACITCHPSYGHGARQLNYNSNVQGNGYLLVLTDENDTYLSSLTGMPQTQAQKPFKAPIDEKQIVIDWKEYTDEWGNRFPDGETYELIYPELTIDESAFYAPLGVPYANLAFRLESTIGIYGTGLIDAIDDDSLKAQYQRESEMGLPLNPAFWNGGDWAPTAFYGNTRHPKRYTYALSRGPLQDAPGSNAIWNITNVTRSNKRAHYITEAYARKASRDANVQARFADYFPEWVNPDSTMESNIYNYLMSKNLPAEMSDQDYVNFMVWHRGLAVPAARNLDDPDVQRGRKLFRDLGCAVCHRPSWTTGEDNFTDPTGFFEDGDSRLPRYPYQKIWPYSDFVQHKLYMKNDIRTGWCRTTPLWGRGLAPLCSGHADRLHDCRARNVIEAIMWHGSAQSDARRSVENFRQLSKADRDAVVKFINAI